MTNDPTNLTPDTTQNAVASSMPLPANFRWRAFGIHLAISLAILAVLLWILFTRWFPDYLFDTDGGWQALRVIAGVDIVLGPLLTLIVANAAKPRRELRRDFTIIGLIQVSALTFGTWLAWDNRPYAMLWYDGAFFSMPYSQIRSEPGASTWLKQYRKTEPILVFVDLPLDPLERAKHLDNYRNDHVSAMFNSSLYRPWPPEPEMLDAFHDLVLQSQGDISAAWKSVLTMHPNWRLVPTKSRYSNYFLLVDRLDGSVNGHVDGKPNGYFFTGLYPGAEIRKKLLGTSNTPQATLPANNETPIARNR